MAYETSTNLQEVGKPVTDNFKAYKERTGVELKLEVEPGTYLVANAGALVTKVQDVACTSGKDKGNDFLKLDAGMTDVLRPVAYMGRSTPWSSCRPTPRRIPMIRPMSTSSWATAARAATC